MKQIKLRFTVFSYAVTKLMSSFVYLLKVDFKQSLEYVKRYIELINSILFDNINVIKGQLKLERLDKNTVDYLEYKIDLLSLQYEHKNNESLLIKIDELNRQLQFEIYYDSVQYALNSDENTRKDIEYLMNKTQKLRIYIYNNYTDLLYIRLMNDLQAKYFSIKNE